MPTTIDRDDVLRLLEAGAQLVDVLPDEEYQNLHLPKALHLPLKRLDRDAAARLETLGFTEVYDYAAGEADWSASGLQLEGKLAKTPRSGDVAEHDVPTCHLTDLVGSVRERAQRAGLARCVVVDGNRVVLGILRRDALEGDPRTTAEVVMQAGPSTFRPDVSLEEMLRYLRDHDLHGALITTNDGILVGWLPRERVEQALASEEQ
ncbi:MAG: CBS domain-containing protein [Chloroflexi bacterium]|nr:CBS domain-containing protein [Chloroflexota bacterium]